MNCRLLTFILKTAWLKLVIFAGVTLAGLRERCRVADQTTLHV